MSAHPFRLPLALKVRDPKSKEGQSRRCKVSLGSAQLAFLQVGREFCSTKVGPRALGSLSQQ